MGGNGRQQERSWSRWHREATEREATGGHGRQRQRSRKRGERNQFFRARLGPLQDSRWSLCFGKKSNEYCISIVQCRRAGHCCVAIVVLQLVWCNRGFATVVLQVLFCSCCFAIGVLLLLFCNCCVAVVVLQLLFCNNCFALAVLQLLFCTCCFASLVLQLVFCNCCPNSTNYIVDVFSGMSAFLIIFYGSFSRFPTPLKHRRENISEILKFPEISQRQLLIFQEIVFEKIEEVEKFIIAILNRSN